MSEQSIFHILNGDALKEQFPKDMPGHVYVARECLIEGDITGENLEAFYHNRATYISKVYDETQQGYYEHVVSQFEGIVAIPPQADVHLWFEDDLFCQVNFWFVLHLLYHSNPERKLYLVRPEIHTMYGFGGLSEHELITAYQSKRHIDSYHLKALSRLWGLYQREEYNEMIAIAKELHETFPFLIPAIQAHLDRLPTADYPGRPKQTLMDIMAELNTKEFGPVFREFCKREPIYGFGDLQVKRLFDEINN